MKNYLALDVDFKTFRFVFVILRGHIPITVGFGESQITSSNLMHSKLLSEFVILP